MVEDSKNEAAELRKAPDTPEIRRRLDAGLPADHAKY